jgi:hypothetical protein
VVLSGLYLLVYDRLLVRNHVLWLRHFLLVGTRARFRKTGTRALRWGRRR